jgi:hypothetical protein
MLRICCWCQKSLGETVPLDVGEATGGACGACTFALLEEIRRESGWVYHIILSRGCAHLLSSMNLLLQTWPHVRVLIDRRRRYAELAIPPQPRPERVWLFAVPPRRHHLVIRRDLSCFLHELGPVFADRQDILVLVDRRARNRAAEMPAPPGVPEQRVAGPPAFLV